VTAQIDGPFSATKLYTLTEIGEVCGLKSHQVEHLYYRGSLKGLPKIKFSNSKRTKVRFFGYDLNGWVRDHVITTDGGQ
jgi:hypothetical protein